MINLVKDSISQEDLDKLADWIRTNPKLTKGDLTIQFEEEFAKFVGSKYAVFVNSGSSANLLALYSYLMWNYNGNERGRGYMSEILSPAISWATTISPIINFGINPILCDANKKNLGIDLKHFKKLHEEEWFCFSTVIVVNVLGFPSDIDKIREYCNKERIFLIEDNCESFGSQLNGKHLGTFGDLGTYSFFYGHGFSTIEGGMVVTDNKDLYDICKMLRSHGWDRDLDKDKQIELRKQFNIDDFQSLYTFYYPSFNVRATDLQAFVGLQQLKRAPEFLKRRNEITLLYDKFIKNDYWKIEIKKDSFVSGHAYPLIFKSKKIKEKVIKELLKNEIETRPLICGSIGRQPFFTRIYGEVSLPMADKVHDKGIYVPIHPQMTNEEVEFVCKVINKALL
jgi:CDP-6-deoxy-D-xylo-4-hexulose-3-dehydrase